MKFTSIDFVQKDLQENESIVFFYPNYFDVILGWDESMNVFGNYDLCAFYKKKDKSTGGIFPYEYHNRKSDLGSLNVFPYMSLMGEERPNHKYDVEDIIRIANIQEMEEVFIVAIDYDAAIEEVTGFNIPVTLKIHNSEPAVTISYSRTIEANGAVLLLAILKESGNSSVVITNQSKLMTLPDAFNEIPGFDSIVTS